MNVREKKNNIQYIDKNSIVVHSGGVRTECFPVRIIPVASDELYQRLIKTCI